MKSILFEIQDVVSKYADIMSKITGINVEVMDKNFIRIAGTGIFKDRVNLDMSTESDLYTQTIKSGKKQVITDPGNNPLCLNCKNRNNCNETFEISMPIQFKEEIIGVIGMMSTDKKQRAILSEKLPMYLELLEQISGFISSKVFEYVETKEIKASLAALDCVTTQMKQGVIILGKNQTLTFANNSAKIQLRIDDDFIGSEISIYSTGDILEDMSEYHIRVNEKKTAVVGKITVLADKNDKIEKLLVFSDIRSFQDSNNQVAVNPIAVENIIGTSDATKNLRQKILKVAKSNSTVFITGESGTGKEMVATAIWKASDRCENQFVAVNCGAIPEPLLESELFGYVKGAFTGANAKGRMGKFELANNGIIFLDEIGDMPLYLQVKLLRVLQERKIVRIGSNQIIPLNIRVIAATNKNLKKMVAENTFREDLYYRLNVIPIYIEPLRRRKADIEILMKILIAKYCDLNGKRFVTITDNALNKIKEYSWPGNVRELENAVEFMINMMEIDGIIDEKTLPAFVKTNMANEIQLSDEEDSVLPIKYIEKREIEKALSIFGNSTEQKRQVAEALGIGIATLYRKIEKYNI